MRLRARVSQEPHRDTDGCSEMSMGWAELSRRWRLNDNATSFVGSSFNILHKDIFAAVPFRVLVNRRQLQVAWVFLLLVQLFTSLVVILYSLVPCRSSHADAINATNATLGNISEAGGNITEMSSAPTACASDPSMWWSEVIPRWAISCVLEYAVDALVILCKSVAIHWCDVSNEDLAESCLLSMLAS